MSSARERKAPSALAQVGRIALVGKQPMRDDEAGASAPRVGAEAAGPAHLSQVVAVDDLECKAELRRQLVAPLLSDCRRRDPHQVDSPAQEELPHDETRLQRFSVWA